MPSAKPAAKPPSSPAEHSISPKLLRMFKMFERIRSPRGVRVVDLISEFGITDRTLRRYIRDFRALGQELDIPIDDLGTGLERTLRLSSDYRQTGIRMSLLEILCLHFGRTLFNFLEGTDFDQGFENALTRLEPTIPRTQANLLKDLDRKFLAVSEPAKSYSDVDTSELIDEMVSALIHDRPATARYARPTGEPKDYELEPLTLATYRQGLYLFARDRIDDRVKTFAVERFLDFTRSKTEYFSPPEDYDPRRVVASGFGIVSGPTREVSIRFRSNVAWLIRERHWHDSQRLEELDGGEVRLTLKVALNLELKTWLLGFGSSAVVEGPDSLVQDLREEYRRALENLEAL